MKTEKDNLATRFLLGKLTEPESVKLEESYFNSNKAFEEMIFAETDLIDAYVTGKLSSEDQKLFESRLLLNPRQRQKVEFTRALLKYASNTSLPAEDLNAFPAKLSWTSFISHFLTNKPELAFTFTVAILIFFASIWLIFKKQDPQFNRTDELTVIQTPGQVQNQNQRPNNVASNSSQAEERQTKMSPSPSPEPVQPKAPPIKREGSPKKKAPLIFSLILSPGLTRDAGASQKFTIPAKTDFVRMQLKFEPGSFSSYHGTLETVEGHQVWSGQKLKVQKGARFLIVSIPSKLLKQADYILMLKGINPEGIYENVESYPFTILRAKSNE